MVVCIQWWDVSSGGPDDVFILSLEPSSTSKPCVCEYERPLLTLHICACSSQTFTGCRCEEVSSNFPVLCWFLW